MLEDILGFDLLASLLGVSRRELFQYDASLDQIPEVICQRFSFIDKIFGILIGAYNDDGIRQWFLRQRVQLSNRSPAEILKNNWSPDEPEPASVLELAESINI